MTVALTARRSTVSSLEIKPSEIGWYANTRCWDPHEGIFPVGVYWDGEQWIDSHPHTLCDYYPYLVFDNVDEAIEFAYDNLDE